MHDLPLPLVRSSVRPFYGQLAWDARAKTNAELTGNYYCYYYWRQFDKLELLNRHHSRSVAACQVARVSGRARRAAELGSWRAITIISWRELAALQEEDSPVAPSWTRTHIHERQVLTRRKSRTANLKLPLDADHLRRSMMAAHPLGECRADSTSKNSLAPARQIETVQTSASSQANCVVNGPPWRWPSIRLEKEPQAATWCRSLSLLCVLVPTVQSGIVVACYQRRSSRIYRRSLLLFS